MLVYLWDDQISQHSLDHLEIDMLNTMKLEILQANNLLIAVCIISAIWLIKVPILSLLHYKCLKLHH